MESETHPRKQNLEIGYLWVLGQRKKNHGLTILKYGKVDQKPLLILRQGKFFKIVYRISSLGFATFRQQLFNLPKSLLKAHPELAST